MSFLANYSTKYVLKVKIFSPRVYPFSKMEVKWRDLTLFISSLLYFGKNYTIVIEITILFTMPIEYTIKISHGISRIYLQRRPIRAIKTSKIYITKVIK